MTLISRLRIPPSEDISRLYVKPNSNLNLRGEWINSGCIYFHKAESVSFNTYFNSIYEYYLAKYTFLSDCFYRLYLEGDFKITIYRETLDSIKTVVSHNEFLNCNLNIAEFLPVSLSRDLRKTGRIYLELQCLSERGKFLESTLETEQKQTSVLSLAIISCTYKKEKYIDYTAQKIIRCPYLKEKQFKFFIIDNGNTLSINKFTDNRIILTQNSNLGSSGGFTKGLVTSIDSLSEFTHCLLMDDDIEIDEDVILRVFSLYEYARQPFIITGSMLDNYKKHLLYESGGKFGFRQSETFSSTLEPDLLACAPLKHNLNLQDSTNLNALLKEEEFDYSGFWFCALPIKAVKDFGLPLPFFIKVDDMEYGLRLKENGVDAVAFPGLAVWHDPFYAKRQVQWAEYYYYVRNRLIVNAIYRNYSAIQTIPRLTKRFMGRLMTFDYAGADLCLTAVQDYLKGESALTGLPLDVKHQFILKINNKYNSGLISSETEPPNSLQEHSNQYLKMPFALRITLSIITLNGHLLPHFMLDHEHPTIVSLSNDDWMKVFGRSRILIHDTYAGVFEKRILHKEGLKLFIKWVLTMIRLLISWKTVRNSWRQAFPRLITETFWRSFLGS